MSKVMIISRQSMQTERFMKHVRNYQATQELPYEVELAYYPKYLEAVDSYQPDFVLLSTEVIAWQPEIEMALDQRKIPHALVKGSHYGTAQVLRIFADSVKL